MSKYKLPGEYLYIDDNGDAYFKSWKCKKKQVVINAYNIASTPVIFSKNATVNTLFKLVDKYPYLKPFLFYFDEFKAEKDLPKKFNIEGAIRFYWPQLEIDKKFIQCEYPKLEVDGINPNGELFSIEFLAVNEIRDLGLAFYLEKDVYNDNFEKITSTNLYPTLWQVLYGFFWEISFLGSPEDREKESKALKKSLENIKKDLDIVDK